MKPDRNSGVEDRENGFRRKEMKKEEEPKK